MYRNSRSCGSIHGECRGSARSCRLGAGHSIRMSRQYCNTAGQEPTASTCFMHSPAVTAHVFQENTATAQEPMVFSPRVMQHSPAVLLLQNTHGWCGAPAAGAQLASLFDSSSSSSNRQTCPWLTLCLPLLSRQANHWLPCGGSNIHCGGGRRRRCSAGQSVPWVYQTHCLTRWVGLAHSPR